MLCQSAMRKYEKYQPVMV